MTIIIGLIVIILLIISLLPNYKAMVLAKQQGQKPTRYTIMVGIDLLFIINYTYYSNISIKIDYVGSTNLLFNRQ